MRSMNLYKQGFLVIEAMIYGVVSCAVLFFFILVLRETMVFHAYSNTSISQTLYHYHALQTVQEDCAKSYSVCSVDPYTIELYTYEITAQWKRESVKIIYNIKKSGFYRSIYKNNCLHSSLYLSPPPQSVAATIIDSSIYITYQISNTCCLKVKVPCLCRA
jgi:hypothetical protein